MERITRTITTTQAVIKAVDLDNQVIIEDIFSFYRDFKKNKDLLTKYAEKELKKSRLILLEVGNFWTIEDKYSMSISDFIEHATKDGDIFE